MVEFISGYQLRFKVIKDCENIGFMLCPSRAVATHDSAQIVAVFRDRSAIGQYKMEYEPAKHTESGGGKRHCERVVRQYFKSEWRDSAGWLFGHALKIRQICRGASVRHY